MKTIIEARNINKIYQEEQAESSHVLKNINMSVEKGEFAVIMGQSGSGKSTLLYQLSGMDRMSEGSVLFSGEELAVMKEEELSDLRLKKMGFIFQQSTLLKNLNIFDNIVLPSYLSKKESKRCIRKRAKELMKHTGISETADRDISQVSGGQLQRASICRALMNNPEVLFGDEPTGSLNSSSTQEVLEILADINESGTTVLLVTHDPKVAARADRVLFMKDGQLSGEKKLGKYHKDIQKQKNREELLMNWLIAQGF